MNKNYEKVNYIEISSQEISNFVLPDSKKTKLDILFINNYIQLSGCRISINLFKPGEFMPFNHKHFNNEETFIITSGTGECEIDGEKIKVKEGSIINVKPNAIRNICNTSKNELLKFLIIQTKENSVKNNDGIGTGERGYW